MRCSDVLEMLQRRGATLSWNHLETDSEDHLIRYVEGWSDPNYPHPIIVYRHRDGSCDVYTADTPHDLEQLEQLLDSERVLRD